jgi:hypothetical protein
MGDVATTLSLFYIHFLVGVRVGSIHMCRKYSYRKGRFRGEDFI